MHKLMKGVIGFLLIGGLFSHVSAEGLTTRGDVIASVNDATTVDEAVRQITTTLERQGFDIALVVDHAAGAASVGLELAPTQVILARPPRFFERRLLRRNATVALDLPLKILVFEVDGEIQLRFNSIGYLIERHDIVLRDFLLHSLDSVIEQFGGRQSGIVTVASLGSIEETVDGLRAAISANPAFRVPLVLDFNANRRARKRPFPVLIVFGNPNAGTPLMQVDQRIGIDLPQKFLVWQDKQGGVNISYNSPQFLADRYNVQGQDARLEAIANALRRFALVGAGKDPNGE
ncbi:MAG: DUF302 domain-containing protein [Thiotrichales bacterium]|nr:DUF302 domain-containing protein [Thiotrichales bacterium]